jgi:GT2 family glycosyltransferase
MKDQANWGPRLGPLPARVGIVILNWNGHDVLQDCLRSIFALGYPCFQVIVVDNGSTDVTTEMLERDYPNVLRIENKVNLGFAAGNNQGIRLALERGNEYVLVLNNDTILDPDCLTRLVERAQSDSRIAAISPKIYFAQPPDSLWFAGGTFNYWTGRNGHVGYKKSDTGSWNAAEEVEFISGCALLTSRTAWQNIGGFDELLFTYSEDVDWSLRVRKAGFKLFYEPRAVVWHRESFSTVRNGWQAIQLYYCTRNPMVVMWKQGRWWHWITFLPFHVALSLKRMLQALARHDWTSIVKIVEGFRDFPALARQAKSSQRTKVGLINRESSL